MIVKKNMQGRSTSPMVFRDAQHMRNYQLVVRAYNEYILVQGMGITYQELGYSTGTGEVPAHKLAEYIEFRRLEHRFRPRPKKRKRP